MNHILIYLFIFTACSTFINGDLKSDKSVVDIRDCHDASSSGVYTIQPTIAGPSFIVYCDTESEGGPWMLLWSYGRHETGHGNENPLVEDTIPPISPTNGYSHTYLNSFTDVHRKSIFSASRVRFYCETSLHPRRISFFTSNAEVLQMATTGNMENNHPGHWNTDFTAMGDHTAYLPGATTHVCPHAGNSACDEEKSESKSELNSTSMRGFSSKPFFMAGNYNWNIGYQNQFQCDDNDDHMITMMMSGNSTQSTSMNMNTTETIRTKTIHQVWVSTMAVAVASPSTSPTAKPSTSPTSRKPSTKPSTKPTSRQPSVSPSLRKPSSFPTNKPSTKPTTTSPSSSPTVSPSVSPSTSSPTVSPSVSPSTSPSSSPT
eukprot:gene4232-8421_t